MMSDDFPPIPPSLNGVETGWLEPFVTGVAEKYARAGAIAAIRALRRLPTVAEARRGVEACELAFEPDWEAHTASVLPAPSRSFLAVCLKTGQARDDDPDKLCAALETYWQQEAASSRTRRSSLAAQQAFVEGLSTPTLLVLAAVVDALTAAQPNWDACSV